MMTLKQIALGLIDRALANNIRLAAWTFDELYGRDGKFLDGLQECLTPRQESTDSATWESTSTTSNHASHDPSPGPQPRFPQPTYNKNRRRSGAVQLTSRSRSSNGLDRPA